MIPRNMQSFLGRLNYYNSFIEDYAVYASILYELSEMSFHAQRSQLERDDKILPPRMKTKKGRTVFKYQSLYLRIRLSRH